MRKTPNGAGYRRPPKEHCWKKGQSGNPRGRPPGMRNLAAALTAVLHENVSVSVAGEEMRIPLPHEYITTVVGDPSSFED